MPSASEEATMSEYMAEPESPEPVSSEPESSLPAVGSWLPMASSASGRAGGAAGGGGGEEVVAERLEAVAGRHRDELDAAEAAAAVGADGAVGGDVDLLGTRAARNGHARLHQHALVVHEAAGGVE